MSELISVGSYKLDESGEPSSTIITSNNWPEMIDKAGLRGQWLELALIPINQLGGDWSLLEATQDSLREHSAECKKLRARIAELEAERAELVKDRERLDWLESVGEDFTAWLADDGTTTWDYSPDGKQPVGGSGVTLRQAIDAARDDEFDPNPTI